MLSHFLATLLHRPPVSPHEFLNPDCEAANLLLPRVLFCDCSVSVSTPDLDGKLSCRAAGGCHLGWDRKRRGFAVYVKSLGRISTFRVIS